jgi:PGF-CTERM protein
MPDTDTATPTPTEGGGPGFGAVVALVALLAAALLATRRDN